MARKKGFRLTVPCACTYSIKGQAMQFARRFAGRERALGKEGLLPAFRQGLRLRPPAVFVGIRLVFSIGLEPALPLLIFFKQQLPPVEGGSAARLVRRQIEFLADKVKNRDGSNDKEKRHNVHRAPHSVVKKLRTVSVEYHQDWAFRQMLCSASRQKTPTPRCRLACSYEASAVFSPMHSIGCLRIANVEQYLLPRGAGRHTRGLTCEKCSGGTTCAVRRYCAEQAAGEFHCRRAGGAGTSLP